MIHMNINNSIGWGGVDILHINKLLSLKTDREDCKCQDVE